jgi:crossover junction endodeoxyribonuclease RuvC
MRAVRILGVDPGSRVTGYAVVERRGLAEVRYLSCGVIEPRREASLAERLAEVAAGLREVIVELRPEAAAVEDVFYAVHARSALRLGHARGVALLCAAEAALPVFEYPPARIKRAIAGWGRANKKQMAAMVQRLFGLRRPPRSDAADALAVALCHARASGFGERLSADRRGRAR